MQGDRDFSEPVINRNFPDPDVILVGDTYYAYSTESNLRNVQMATSKDLVDWEVLNKDAMPNLPGFALKGRTWAPEVVQFAPDYFVLYYTARNAKPDLQCLGVAIADNPEGPFVTQGDQMLVCPQEWGGAIDATTILDGETRYLIWKNDGNCCGKDTWMWAAELSPDGLSLMSVPEQLFKQDLEWEGNLVEAPTILKKGGKYVMLYSANSYGSEIYKMGFATADNILGPWIKNPDPLLASGMLDRKIRGPGGQDIVTRPDGSTVLMLHGWNRSNSARYLYSIELDWNGAIPKPRID